MNEQQKRWAKALAELKAQQRRGRHRRTQPAARLVVGRRDPEPQDGEAS
jgi:hypothetical protein